MLPPLAALLLVACGGGQHYESGGKGDHEHPHGYGDDPALSTVNLPPPLSTGAGGEESQAPGEGEPGAGGTVADGTAPGSPAGGAEGDGPTEGHTPATGDGEESPAGADGDPTDGGDDGAQAEGGGEGSGAHPSPAGYDGVTPPPRAPQDDPLCPYGAPRAELSCERACALAESCSGEQDEGCVEECELNIRAFSAAAIEQIEDCLEELACEETGEEDNEEGEAEGDEPGFDLMGACLSAAGYPLPLEVAAVCHDLERHALGCGADLGEVEALRGLCLSLAPNLHKEAVGRLVSCAGAACADMIACMSYAGCADLSGMSISQ